MDHKEYRFALEDCVRTAKGKSYITTGNGLGTIANGDGALHYRSYVIRKKTKYVCETTNLKEAEKITRLLNEDHYANQ